MSPSMRSFGASPATMCRSDALRAIISSSSARRLTPVAAWAASGFDRQRIELGSAVMSVFVFGVVRRRPLVSRTIWSSGVIPLMTLSQPSMRRVSMPSSMAASLDLGRADVLHDQPAEARGHGHDLVEALTSFQSRSVACSQPLPLKNGQIADACVERHGIWSAAWLCRSPRLRVLERHRSVNAGRAASCPASPSRPPTRPSSGTYFVAA